MRIENNHNYQKPTFGLNITKTKALTDALTYMENNTNVPKS